MTDSRQDEALVRAFELIEEERLAEARELVQTVLDDNDNNADAWWIYAHAVEDRAEARRALNKVGDIDPNYDGLQELLTYYDDVALDEADDLALEADYLDTFDDDLDFVDDDFDQITEQPIIAEHKDNPWPRRIVIITVILLLALVGYLILNGARQKADEDAPVVVLEPTLEPTNEAVILLPEDEAEIDEPIEELPIDSEEVTEEIFEESPSVSELSLILGDYSLANDEFAFIDTALGRTQTINLCNDDRESLRDTIQNALMAFSNNLGLIELDTQAIAVRILGCEQQETLSFIGVSIDNAILYDAGEITDQEFIGTWTVLD